MAEGDVLKIRQWQISHFSHPMNSVRNKNKSYCSNILSRMKNTFFKQPKPIENAFYVTRIVHIEMKSAHASYYKVFLSSPKHTPPIYNTQYKVKLQIQ